MKYKNIYAFYVICSTIAFFISAIAALTEMPDYAIYTLLVAIHTNMLSWNYESDEEE